MPEFVLIILLERKHKTDEGVSEKYALSMTERDKIFFDTISSFDIRQSCKKKSNILGR